MLIRHCHGSTGSLSSKHFFFSHKSTEFITLPYTNIPFSSSGKLSQDRMKSSPRQCFRLLLQQSTEEKAVNSGKIVHAHVIRTGSVYDSSVYNRILNFYMKCGLLREAKFFFDKMPDRDLVSYNCLINGYSQLGLKFSVLAFDLLRKMRISDLIPNAFTFSGIFTAASHHSNDLGGKQAHALSIKFGLCPDEIYVGSSLLNMYCKLCCLSDAQKLFDEMPHRNSVSWATMISGYAIERRAVEVFDLFKLMMGEKLCLNEFVITSALSSMVQNEYVENGRQIHGISLKNGLESFISVSNALITMYAKCGSLNDSHQMFEMARNKNSITWSAIITGYAQSGDSNESVKFFSEMHFAGLKPSEFTLVGILNACSDLAALKDGTQVHSYLLKLGFDSQIFIRTALIDMYAKCGNINDARKGFDQIKEADTVLWTSMIGGYVQNGENEEALSLYGRMEMFGVVPNELTMVNILKACSKLTALDQGKQIHARTIKYGLSYEILIGSTLCTMYAKCGSHEDGCLVFRRMPKRDVISWNSMISGFSQNGLGSEALNLFNEMKVEGVEPDSVTFVNLLSACSHKGLVKKGWTYFHSMYHDHGIIPGIEHYACMVDILSRAGMLKKAKEFIDSTPIDHGMCLWRILLGACRNQRNFDIGACAGEKLIELGSQESSTYVLLSSIYAASGQIDDVVRIRRIMRLRGVNKEPGSSWIEVRGRVHVFVVGDLLHPQISKICEEVGILTRHMKDEGYDPDFESFYEN